MTMIVAIALGGALGALMRYGVIVLAGPGNPWAIMAVNISGSFVMGLSIGVFTYALTPSPEFRAFLTTGLLGGYTTFSAFSADAIALLQKGQAAEAVVYVAGSTGLSILGLYAGLVIIRWWAA